MSNKRRAEEDANFDTPKEIKALGPPEIFRLTLKEAGPFKRVIASIKDFVNDANFYIDREGFKTQTMDNAHVSLLVLCLDPKGFEEYTVSRDSITVGFNLASFYKILDLTGPMDRLTIWSKDPDTLVFNYKDPKQGKTGVVDMKLLDIDCETFVVPETAYKATIEICHKIYIECITDLVKFGDEVKISVSKTGITFETQGDLASPKISFEVGKTDGLSIKCSEDLYMTFALPKLENFSKAVHLADRLILKMDPETPIQLDLTFEGLGSLKFYLAPKILNS